MLCRYEAARDQAPSVPIKDRFELLLSVVNPGEELLEASLTLARKNGVSRLARRLAASRLNRDFD